MSKEEYDQKNIHNFLKAISSEITVLWNRYYETIGKMIENLNDDEPLLCYYKISEGYFSVYEQNTNMLGNIDEKLSNKIIEIYTLMRGIKDSFDLHNNNLRQYEQYVGHKLTTGGDEFKDLKKGALIIRQLSLDIKNNQKILKDKKDNLIKSVKQYLAT